MNRKFLALIGIAALTAHAVFSSAAAQTAADYQQRHSDLVSLASIFGTLHHIRRNCEPRMEADAWRNRMKRIVELEDPQPAAREEMVKAFNRAYRDAQRRFPGCSRTAEDYAAARADAGDEIVARLMAPLYEAMESYEDAPQIWRGNISPSPPIIDQDAD